MLRNRNSLFFVLLIILVVISQLCLSNSVLAHNTSKNNISTDLTINFTMFWDINGQYGEVKPITIPAYFDDILIYECYMKLYITENNKSGVFGHFEIEKPDQDVIEEYNMTTFVTGKKNLTNQWVWQEYTDHETEWFLFSQDRNSNQNITANLYTSNNTYKEVEILSNGLLKTSIVDLEDGYLKELTLNNPFSVDNNFTQFSMGRVYDSKPTGFDFVINEDTIKFLILGLAIVITFGIIAYYYFKIYKKK